MVENGDAQKVEEVPLNKDASAKQGLCPTWKEKEWTNHTQCTYPLWFFFFTYLFAFFPHLCDLLSLSEKSFRDCLLSRFFMWHLLWLSVMQLRHYLFIGTLNPMLQRLTAGESSLGNRTNTTSLSLSSKHLNVILLNQHALGTLKMHQCLNSASLINWLILHSKCSDLQTKTPCFWCLLNHHVSYFGGLCLLSILFVSLQWVSTPMPLRSPSYVACCVLPGTASLWTDTRANHELKVTPWL